MHRRVSRTARTVSSADNSEWIVEDSNAETEDDFFGPRHSTMMRPDESSFLPSMSFASLQIGECKPMDGEDEVDKKSFERWLDVLQSGMDFAGITEEAMRASIFKMKAGAKLLDILDNTSSQGAPDIVLQPYSNAMFRLRQYYGSRDYILLQRQKLRSLSQGDTECDLKYVRRISAHAKLCGYNEDQLAETVADVLQTHALNRKVREAARKAARKGSSLQELVNRVRNTEIEKHAEDIFTRNHTKSSSAVCAISYASSRPQQRASRGAPSGIRGRGYFQKTRGGVTRGGGRTPCWRCSSIYHSQDQCFAATKVCNLCQTKGHIQRACSKQVRPKREATDEPEATSTPKIRKIAAVSTSPEPAVDEKDNTATRNTDTEKHTKVPDEFDNSSSPHVNGSCDSKDKLTEVYNAYVMCTLNLNDLGELGSIVGLVAGIRVKFLIDSGAEVNTIGENVFDEIMNGDPTRNPIYSLQKGSDRPLRAYATPKPIPVTATFFAELTITPDRPRLVEKFYVVPGARALLGRSTATRYSVLQIGLRVPIRQSTHEVGSAASTVYTVDVPGQFPKFNVAPVSLSYDKSLPPSRKIYTNIPPAFKEETNRRLQELLAADIIERVSGNMDRTFCSSLLVVPKGKQDIRLVVDLRGPNRCIIRTPFRMPTLEEILPKLNGSCYFSTIDLTSAFFHVVLEESSRHLTNFYTGNDTFRFKRLPFGLTNAPDLFQEILQTVILADCPGTVNYLDDILVFGKTKQEHDKNLQRTMLRLREHNVSLNAAKCVFGKQSVKFLGFRLSHDGWRVDDDKRKAIEGFRRPETLSEVKSFLGLINFSEKFIRNRAELTTSLRELANSNEFYWTEEEEREFLYIKEVALNSIERLGYFNHRDTTELFVDASPCGLGAVLVQFDSTNSPRIIACISKALTIAEKRYPQTQKEALAIVWAVERFGYYLTSKQFTVRTDSEANKFIFGNQFRTGKRSMTRAETWALRLLPYNFSIERVPGTLNIADVLSRLICESQSDEPFDEDNDKHMLYTLDAGNMAITWAEIQAASEEDDELSQVRLGIQTGKWSDRLGRYECQAKQLRSLDPLIFKGDLIVLPRSLRERALKTAHEGHLGCNATKRILREHFWWPNMSKEAQIYVNNCTTCLVISRKNPPIPLVSRRLPDGPWQIIQIDFLSVPGCGTGHFLMCVDTYSRYLHVAELKHTDAKSTNAALCNMFKTWGLPRIMQSDNGPPFMGREFKEFWLEKGISVRNSIQLSPQSNGSIERQNQGVIKALAAAKEENRNCIEALQQYVHLHNTRKPHSRLGVTPFELLVGWRYRGTFPILWDAEATLDREKVREDDAHTKLISKKYADQRRGAKESNITVGDKVVVAIAQRTKTDPTFSKEEFTVLTREGAKIVLLGDSGVQLTRNVQDVKRIPASQNNDDGAPEDRDPSVQINEGPESQDNDDSSSEDRDPSAQINDGPSSSVNPTTSSETVEQSRPRRTLRPPARFDDMELYRIQ